MGARQGLPGSLAARVTYLLEPKNWLIVTVVGVGFHADGLAGAGWGLLAAFFAAVLPTVFISYGIRHGKWDDRNVGARRPRLVLLAFITASVATGLILLVVLGAPVLLTGYLAFMLVSVAALAAITLVWKISIHCAVASGSVIILALTYGPLALVGYLLVGLLGWSRVAVRDHTVAQVLGGAVLGAAAALAYTAFLRVALTQAVSTLAAAGGWRRGPDGTLVHLCDRPVSRLYLRSADSKPWLRPDSRRDPRWARHSRIAGGFPCGRAAPTR